MTASIGLHDDENGCGYAAFQVKPFQWFCTKCGHGWREAPSVSEHGTEAVLGQDFYRCPNTGEWVYRWADERLVLAVPTDLADVHPDCKACGTAAPENGSQADPS